MKGPRDRVVFVTGASSGIGLATARAFLADGARVAACARSEIRGLEGALCLRCDVRRPDEVRAAVEAVVARYGALHVLVNNAGFGIYGPVENTTPEGLEDIFRTNTFGPVYAVQAALPHLRRTGGQVINVSSTLARATTPFAAAYCMTKHALHAFSKSLRVELKPQGVHVIEVAPGLTQTGFQKSAVKAGVSSPVAPANEKGWPPDRVAQAIVRASRRGSREVWLTWDGRMFIRLYDWFPRLADWVVGRWARRFRGAPP